MYRISQLMSTPVASKYLLTASHFACRRSPRLLSNGYYTWTEDSFLYDKDGNITLSPPQTSVLYKENLVRIFRKKKRVHRSFSNLFSLRTSKSWLHGNIFGDVDSSLSEDTWLEGVRRLDMEHCSETGGDSDCSLTDAWESEQPNVAPSSSHAMSQIPRQNSHDGALQSHVMASEHFPGNILDRAKASLWQDVSFPAILLAVFLIICACARWFLEGILVSVFTCSLVVILACLPKFDSHLRMSLMNAFNLNIQKLSDLQSAWNQLFYWRRMRSWIIEKKIF
ncbi:transmembrane protein 71 isoform X7 [Mustela putorius furo]|uniref:Transmembrane protein 71 isoform X7 n=1 Tax=Mustela putorius furo TaxID=9669 RepID=A0A8U0MIQ5_MUSPF|nr:transmembrane protein 71 isoform X7 [Mustela putorius furo]XP_044934077.1 transmembrane protein 71 isoform X7 [Mustela putorius furo]